MRACDVVQLWVIKNVDNHMRVYACVCLCASGGVHYLFTPKTAVPILKGLFLDDWYRVFMDNPR